MEKIINSGNLRNFAYVNDGVCKKPVKGILINFFGLGHAPMYDWDILEGEFYGSQGILYVVPYTNPWAWCNRQTVEYVDEIIDVVIKKFGLENAPIVSSGESMGGLSAIVYCAYAKRTPVACVANCPVCDAAYHFTERNDLPRTMYSAIGNYEGTLEDALKSISPVHIIEKLPDIPYHIFHCGGDNAVKIAYHSDIFVEKMRKLGRTVTYDTIPERGHCDIGYELKKLYAKYVADEINKK